MFGKALQRFVDQAPVCVMVRLAMERALGADAPDGLFRETARRQYEKELLFSAVVKLMMAVVCGSRRSVHDAYRQQGTDGSDGADPPVVSLAGVYNKLNGVEPGVSAELVRHSARRLRPLIRLMRQDRPSPLPPYPLRIVDGNHLARTTWPGPSTDWGCCAAPTPPRCRGRRCRGRRWRCWTRRPG